MENYFSKMIATFLINFKISDKQSFKIADAETGVLLSDLIYRFNGTNFEYFNVSKNAWIVSNTQCLGLFTGNWVPVLVKESD